MTFDEWFHKEYEPADLQIKQYAERNEGLHIPAKVYLEDLKKAFEAGLHTDVHTDNSKVIAELKAQIEKMKKYIKACWVEENLNDYSSYITNSSDEFRDLVKELDAEVRNGR